MPNNSEDNNGLQKLDNGGLEKKKKKKTLPVLDFCFNIQIAGQKFSINKNEYIDTSCPVSVVQADGSEIVWHTMGHIGTNKILPLPT